MRDNPEAALPVGVVEAKGAHSDGSTDRNASRTAITQAHSHLGEINVGHTDVPSGAIRDEDQALGRELNIGLLAVSNDGVTLLERPRLVGTDSTPTGREVVRTIAYHYGRLLQRLTSWAFSSN